MDFRQRKFEASKRPWDVAALSSTTRRETLTHFELGRLKGGVVLVLLIHSSDYSMCHLFSPRGEFFDKRQGLRFGVPNENYH